MAKSNKLNLLITLENVILPSRQTSGNTKHILTLDLIWPRTTIAKRSSVLTIPLIQGACDTAHWSLTNKLCFKETCEFLFGIRASVTEPITRTNGKKLLRYLAGHAIDEAGDAIGTVVPGKLADDVAALPFTYLAKQILGNNSPDLIAEGCLDLNAAEIPETPTTISIPLVAAKSVFKHSGGHKGPARDSGTFKPQNVRNIVTQGDADGAVTLSFTPY